MRKYRFLYIIFAFCCLSVAAMAQQPAPKDSLSHSVDSVARPQKPRTIQQAKMDVKEARKEVREAQEEVRQAKAEIRKKRRVIQWHNEIRIGWGDQFFESLMWHNPTNYILSMPASYKQTYHENYRHHQHLWLEYQYRFTYWFSLGGMVDMSEVAWDDVVRDGEGIEQSSDPNHYFYNAILMPTIRFTYFNHPNVMLYSGLGVGMDINGGTEKNAKGFKTDVGAAMNITVFGVSANYERWFASVDFGGMYALKNINTIFLLSSRIINVSIGARF